MNDHQLAELTNELRTFKAESAKRISIGEPRERPFAEYIRRPEPNEIECIRVFSDHDGLTARIIRTEECGGIRRRRHETIGIDLRGFRQFRHFGRCPDENALDVMIELLNPPKTIGFSNEKETLRLLSLLRDGSRMTWSVLMLGTPIADAAIDVDYQEIERTERIHRLAAPIIEDASPRGWTILVATSSTGSIFTTERTLLVEASPIMRLIPLRKKIGTAHEKMSKRLDEERLIDQLVTRRIAAGTSSESMEAWKDELLRHADDEERRE